MRVELAHDGDEKKIIALLQQYPLELGSMGRFMLAIIRDRIKSSSALVIKDNDILVCAALTRNRKRDNTNLIEHIAVSKDYQGAGYGKMMVNSIIESAIAQSKSFITLTCLDGLPANKFYEHMGFKRAGVKVDKHGSFIIWQMPLERWSSELMKSINKGRKIFNGKS